MLQLRQGELKAGIVFSYYEHPLCYYGCLVGRRLALLLKTWKLPAPGIEMLHTICILRFIALFKGSVVKLSKQKIS